MVAPLGAGLPRRLHPANLSSPLTHADLTVTLHHPLALPLHFFRYSVLRQVKSECLFFPPSFLRNRRRDVHAARRGNAAPGLYPLC